jgi:peptidoglycan hydrolase-like protein with peptidoglycan-binding domain
MLDPEDLTELQRLLNFIWGSEAAGAGTPDGRCGPRTARSVEALQRAHGLDADGVPSPRVLALAREVVKGSAAEAPPPPQRGIGH